MADPALLLLPMQSSIGLSVDGSGEGHSIHDDLLCFLALNLFTATHHHSTLLAHRHLVQHMVG